MNTIIENINALMSVKSDLNGVLKDHGIDGGPVFDEYPDKFRELFRILESTIDDIGEGPYANYEPITNVVKPVISYKDNVVSITCATPGAQIYFRRDYEGWGQYILNFYITHDTFVESYAILNGVRSSTVSLLVPYVRPDEVDPPVISRVNGLVTITHPDENATIWYRIYPNAYVQYDGPINIDDSYTIVAYASLTGMASEEVWSEGSGEPTVVADPVISCSQNIVTMICATEGVTIWYKTGTSTEWHQYVNPITISADTLFTAYAYKNGSSSSQVTYTAQYEEPYVPPVVTPADPVFNINNNTVTITCSTSGATIYWREYGDIEWTEYSTGISISEDTVFEAYAELNGVSSNTVSYSAEYQDYTPEVPVITFDGDNDVFISCATEGATIYYKIDDGSYIEYEYGFGIDEDCTITAYSSKDGYDSETTSLSCVYNDINYNNEYLTFKVMKASTFTQLNFLNFIFDYDMGDIVDRETYYYNNRKSIQVSTDKIHWNTFYPNARTEVNGEFHLGSDPIQLSQGDKLYIRGNNSTYRVDDGQDWYFHRFCFKQTGALKVKISGNIMSLINYSSFASLFTLYSDYALSYILSNYDVNIPNFGPDIVDIKNIKLPATTLTTGCYEGLFYGLTNIKSAPALPATILQTHCYKGMFENCTSLVNTPDLNATIMASHCYEDMFRNCTSIREIKIMAQEAYYYNTNKTQYSLPLTYMNRYLEDDCFNMFNGCYNSNVCKLIGNRNALSNFWNYRINSPADVEIKTQIMPNHWTVSMTGT